MGSDTTTIAREIPIAMPAGDTGRVRVKVPASWKERGNGLAMENEFREAIAAVSFSVSRMSTDVAGTIARIVAGSPQRLARPNINTGDAALDAVRLDVKVVEQGKVAGGEYVVMEIRKPAGLRGPYREQRYAVCSRAMAGGGGLISGDGWAPIQDASLGALVVAAIKSFEIVA